MDYSYKIHEISLSSLLSRVFKIKKELIKEAKKLHDQYGDIIRVNHLGLDTYLISDPKLIKHILIDNYKNYEKGKAFITFHHLVKNGLLTSDGKKWANDRKVIFPNFMKKRIVDHEEIIFQVLKDSKIEEKNEINLSELTREIVIKIISKILFNYSVDDNLQNIRSWINDYTAYIGAQQRGFIKFPIWVPLPKVIKAKKAAARLKTFAKKIFELKKCEDGNMLQRMNLSGIPESDILDHIITLFIAGHDTTINTILFLFYLLNENPTYLEKIKYEVNQLPKNASLEQIEKLEWLNNCLNETFRLFPGIPIFARIAKEDDQITNDFKVNKGAMMAILPWAVHRNNNYWDKPLIFLPERFKDKSQIEKNKFIPFGLGPRKCIGADLSLVKMRHILFYIFRNIEFDIYSNSSSSDFEHDISVSPNKDIFLKNITPR